MLAYWLIKAICLAIARLPNRLFTPLAELLSFLLVPFMRKDLRRIGLNVAYVYNLPHGTHFSRMFARQVMFHQIVANLEAIKIVQKPDAGTFSGVEEFQALLQVAEKDGRGYVIFSGHLGCWELLGPQISKYARAPFHPLAKQSKVRGVSAVLEWLRELVGAKVLWTDDKNLAGNMAMVLGQGGSLGFVMDQKPSGKGKHMVTFLGRDTEFVAGPAAVVAKHGCAAIGVYCIREGTFRYRLMSESFNLPGAEAVKDQTALTQTFAESISKMIRLYPEQWTWNYKRWRDVV